MLEFFYMLMVKFYYKDSYTTRGLLIECFNLNKTFGNEFKDIRLFELFTVFIKAFVFDHGGLSWLIEPKYQFKFSI